MADHPGYILAVDSPYLSAKTRTAPNWSSSILTAVTPPVTDVYNKSSNVGIVNALATGTTTTTSAPLPLITSNHATNISDGFNTNHRGPAHIDAGGYDFFERVYFDPTSASIKVLNSNSIQIRTLSTFRNSNPSLGSITLDTGAGTSMTAEPAYPFGHNYSTYLTTEFTATKNGPSSYAGTITYNYATGDEIFPITVVRVLESPWRPEGKFTEVLEWKTRILPARNLETRAALREQPRIKYSYDFLLRDSEINGFRAAASNAEVPLVTPLWYDEHYVGQITAGATSVAIDTTFSEFLPSSYAFIVQDGGPFEFIETLTVAAGLLTFDKPVINNYSNATIIPACLTVINRAGYAAHNNDVYIGSLSLTGHDVLIRPAVAVTEHDAIGVLTDPSIISSTVKGSFETKGKYLDNKQGVVRFKAIENRVRNSLEHAWLVQGYESRKTMKDWLYSRVGRQKQFLVPTFQNDLFLAAPYAGGTSMDVLESHLEAPFYFQIRLLSGVLYYGTCTTKTTASGVDTLTIVALTDAFAIADIDLFSIMLKQRYASDKFKIKHSNHKKAALKTMTTGV